MRIKFASHVQCPLLAQSGRPLAPVNVRFWGRSGHHADMPSRLLLTQSGPVTHQFSPVLKKLVWPLAAHCVDPDQCGRERWAVYQSTLFDGRRLL